MSFRPPLIRPFCLDQHVRTHPPRTPSISPLPYILLPTLSLPFFPCGADVMFAQLVIASAPGVTNELSRYGTPMAVSGLVLASAGTIVFPSMLAYLCNQVKRKRKSASTRCVLLACRCMAGDGGHSQVLISVKRIHGGVPEHAYCREYEKAWLVPPGIGTGVEAPCCAPYSGCVEKTGGSFFAFSGCEDAGCCFWWRCHVVLLRCALRRSPAHPLTQRALPIRKYRAPFCAFVYGRGDD